MVYGMTYEQYWFGDPWMTKTFEDAYMLGRRVKNEELWLEGLYIYKAVHAVVASAVGGRSEKYVTNPFDFLPKTRAEKQQEEIEKKQKVINYLNSLMVKGNNKRSKGEVSNG